jgi:hypothetical protein
MQLTQVITFVAIAIVGVVAAPGGGHPPPPPPPPARPTSVVQQVFMVATYLLHSSNSPFRLLAMAIQTRTAALQARPEELPARVLKVHLSTAMV